MAAETKKVKLAVDGMSCAHCERKIETALRRLEGVREARASAPLSEVVVVHDPRQCTMESIRAAVRDAGYEVRAEKPAQGAAGGGTPAATAGPGKLSLPKFFGLLIAVVALYLIVRAVGGFNFLPAVSQSMGFGLIFVVGLLTSLHCIAMCGGITLSQTLPRTEGAAAPSAAAGACTTAAPARPGERLLPAILYNSGRVVSYTLLGGVVGALGSVLSLSDTLKGLLPIVAGVFMLFIGVKTLGIFPWLSRLRLRIPGFGGRGKLAAAASKRGPFFVGLLNGLMPCGPLQTMQIYALGTGSFLTGAFSMFLFSLGTVPLLFGFGAVSSLLSARFNRGMLRVSGVLVIVLGLVMFTRGMNLFGVALPTLPGGGGSVAVATLSSGVQTVTTTVDSGRYHPFIVQKGVPVRWIITARAEDLNGCNNPLTIPRYGIRKELVPGENVIEFTPDQDGTIPYTCWMGMISSTIRVVPDLARLTARDLRDPGQGGIAGAFGDSGGAAGGVGGCCSSPAASGRFAGGRVPTDQIAVARRDGDRQVVEIRVDGDGYTPAVAVLQRGLPATIRFVLAPGSLNGCNYVVEFPGYNGRLDLSRGQLETPPLEVYGDFTFRCGMGMLNGYVKVVEDLASVDLGAVRRQVGEFRASVAGNGCCGS